MRWNRRSRNSLAVALALACAPITSGADPEPGGVLVVTATARDYVFGAGGLILDFVDQGVPVDVIHFGNGEKGGDGMKPSEVRERNRREAERAAEILGVRETLFLGHKSGELAYISSSEMRNQLMALVRFYKPRVLVFPDWYMHYLAEDDVYRVGRMAEEAPYGGGSYFLQEMTYMGRGGFAAREYYFYSPYRPYGPREGGEGRAQLKAVDVSDAFDRKLSAARALATANRDYASVVKTRLEAAGRSTARLGDLGEAAVGDLIDAYLREAAETVGAKHGLESAEEFNYLGVTQGVREHIRERARPIPGR